MNFEGVNLICFNVKLVFKREVVLGSSLKVEKFIVGREK